MQMVVDFPCIFSLHSRIRIIHYRQIYKFQEAFAQIENNHLDLCKHTFIHMGTLSWNLISIVDFQFL